MSSIGATNFPNNITPHRKPTATSTAIGLGAGLGAVALVVNLMLSNYRIEQTETELTNFVIARNLAAPPPRESGKMPIQQIELDWEWGTSAGKDQLAAYGVILSNNREAGVLIEKKTNLDGATAAAEQGIAAASYLRPLIDNLGWLGENYAAANERFKVLLDSNKDENDKLEILRGVNLMTLEAKLLREAKQLRNKFQKANPQGVYQAGPTELLKLNQYNEALIELKRMTEAWETGNHLDGKNATALK